jgi:hypothetical protein
MAQTIDRPKAPTNYFEYKQRNVLEGVQLPTAPSHNIRAPEADAQFDFGYLPYKKYRNNNNQGTGLFDYNDPREINSIVDVVLTSFNPNMKHYQFYGIENIPILGQMAANYFGYSYDAVINPFVRSFKSNSDASWMTKLGWGAATAGLNTLTGGIETLDLVANPTKSLLMGHGLNGLQNSLGWGAAGRKNYDWRTGNLAADVALELISDPINWVTLFAKGIISSGLKAGVRGFVQEGVEKLGKEFAGDVTQKMYKRLARKSIDAYLSGDAKTMTQALENLALNMSKQKGWVFNRKLLPKDAFKIMAQVVELAKESTSLKVLQGIQPLMSPVVKTERTLFKAAFLGTLYPVVKTLDGSKFLYQRYEQKQWDRLLEQFTGVDGNINILRFEEIDEAVSDRSAVNTILLGNSSLPDSVIDTLLRQSVKSDSRFFTNLYNAYDKTWARSEEFIEQINIYLKEKYGVENIEEFMKRLRVLGEKYPERFDNIIRYYEIRFNRFKKIISEVDSYTRFKEIEGVASVFREELDDLKNYFFNNGLRAKGNLFFDRLEENPLENFGKPFDLNKLLEIIKTDLQLKIDKIHFTQKSKEGAEVLQDALYARTDLLLRYVEKQIAELKTFVISQLETLAVRAVKPDVELGQLKRVFNILLNKQSSAYKETFERIDRAVDIYVERLTRNEITEYNVMASAKIEDNINDLLDSTKGSARVVNKLIDAIGQNIEKEYGRMKVTPEEVQKSVEGLAKLFTGSYGVRSLDGEIYSPAEWLKAEIELAGVNPYRISPAEFEVLVNALTDIKYTPIHELLPDDVLKNTSIEEYNRLSEENINNFLKEYQEAYLDLSRVLNKQRNLSAQDLNFLSEKKVFSEGFRKFEEYFNDELPPPGKVYEGLVDFSLDSQWMKFKSEQATYVLRAIGHEGISEIMEGILSNSPGIGRVINNYLKIVPEDEVTEILNSAAKEIYKYAENYEAYKSFLSELWKVRLDPKQRVAIISSLERHHHDNPNHMMANLDEWFDDFLDQVESQVYSGTLKKSLRQEAFYENDKTIREAVENVREILGKDALPLHEASSDVVLLEEIIKKELADYFDLENPLIRHLVIDTETVSLNYKGSGMVQYAWKEIGDLSSLTSGQVKITDDIATTLTPQPEALEVFFPKLDSYKTRLQAYRKRFSKAMKDADILDEGLLQSRFSDRQFKTLDEKREAFIERYGLAGLEEARMLYKMTSELETFIRANAGQQVKLIAHNGRNFDFKAIRARLRNYKMNTRVFDDLHKEGNLIDSFVLLKRKHGQMSLSLKQEDIVKDLVTNYVRHYADNGANRFGEVFTKDFRNALNDFDKNSKHHKAKGMIMGFSEEASEISDLKRYLNEISQEIVETRDAFSKVIFSKDLIDTPEMMHHMYNVLKDPEVFGYTDKQIEEIFGITRKYAYGSLAYREREKIIMTLHQRRKGAMSTFHATQLDTRIKLLEALQDSGYEYSGVLNVQKLFANTGDGLSYAGTKYIYDAKLIHNWYPKNILPKTGLMEQLTTFAKKLQKSYKSIKNLRVLEQHQNEIKKVFQELGFMAHLDTLGASNDLVKDIFKLLDFETKTDVQSQWAIIHQIYRSVKEGNADTLGSKIDENFERVFLGDKVSETFERLLEKHPVVKRLLEQPNLINFRNLDYHIDPKFAQPEEFETVISRFYNEHMSLDELSKDRMLHDLISPKTEAYSSAILPLVNLLREVKKIVTNRMNYNHYKRADVSLEQTLRRAQLNKILTLDSITLRNLMVHRAEFITFDYYKSMTDEKFLQSLNNLLSRKKELKDLGIEITEKDSRVYLALNLKQFKREAHPINGEYQITFNGEIIPTVKLEDLDFGMAKKLFTEVVDNKRVPAKKMLEHLYETDSSIRFLSDSDSSGSLRDIIKPEQIKEMYNQLPSTVQKQLGSLHELLKDAYHSNVRFNFMNLGDVGSRRAIDQYSSGSLITNYTASMQEVIERAHVKFQYANMLFNKTNNINVGELGKMSEAQLVQMFKAHPEYKLAVLVKKGASDFELKEIRVLNKGSIKLAKKLNAQILTYQTYATAYSSINLKYTSNSFLKVWRILMYLYKVGYLGSPGSWVRNYIDSSLKTAIDTGVNPLQVLNKQFKAIQSLRRYSKTVEGVIAKSEELNQAYKREELQRVTEAYETALKRIEGSQEMKDFHMDTMRLQEKYYADLEDMERLDTSGRFTDKALNAYYATPGLAPKLDRESFEFVHRFIVDGPSAGLAGTPFNEYFYKASLDKIDTWGHIQHQMNKLLTPHQRIEQANRLAQHILLHEAGVNTTSAYYRIAKTHFDYKTMTKGERVGEMIFPFYTFFTRNMDYWIRLSSEKPGAMKIIMDMMQPIWGMEDLDHTELSYNGSLQYQILSGNIPIYKNMTFKLSPSFMDILQIALNPVGATHSRLAQPIKMATSLILHDSDLQGTDAYGSFLKGLSDMSFEDEGSVGRYILRTLPMLGVVWQSKLTRDKYYERTGQIMNWLLPSVFGATKRWEDRNYPKKPKQSKGKWKNYGRKPRKVYPTYDRQSYASRRRGYSRDNRYSQNVKNRFKVKHYWRHYPNYPHQFYYKSFYKKHYTPTGMSKLKMRTAPVTSGNLQYRIKDMFYQFKD